MAKRPVPRVQVKLGRSGALAWPAPLRHRWDSDYLMVEDHGTYAIVRPADDDDPNSITRQRPPRK